MLAEDPSKLVTVVGKNFDIGSGPTRLSHRVGTLTTVRGDRGAGPVYKSVALRPSWPILVF